MVEGAGPKPASRFRRLTRVWWRRIILRRVRHLGRGLAEMPNHPVDVSVRERRATDEIRAYYPDYRTPSQRNRHWY